MKVDIKDYDVILKRDNKQLYVRKDDEITVYYFKTEKQRDKAFNDEKFDDTNVTNIDRYCYNDEGVADYERLFR